MTLIYLASAWLAGIALANALPIPWQFLALLGLAGLVGLIGWRGGRRSRLFCLCLLMLALGGGRLLLARPRFDARSLATYNDLGPVTLEGIVAAEPDVREDYANLRLRAERLTLADGRQLQVEGLVLVRTSRYPTFAYGDRLLVSGPLETPPSGQDFSYRDYLARQGVHSLMQRCRARRIGADEGHPLYAALLALKGRAQAVIAAILHEPAASLLTGILLGVESSIPAEVMEAFSATGTTHIIVISGSNLSMIAAIIAAVSRRLVGKERATWLAIAGVVLYTIFVGGSAAVVRAAIMSILYLLGRHIGRATFAPTSLAASALVMTAINPFALWDIGFQLSFAATAGLVLYAAPLEQGATHLLARITSRRRAEQTVGWLSEALLITLAAQITTLPLILVYFKRLSLVTILTNLLILPCTSLLMSTGLVATIAGLLWLPAGKVLGWLAWLPLTYTIEAVRLTARVPYAWVDLGRMEPWMGWAMYAALAAVTWVGYQPAERRRALVEGVRAAALALTARVSDRLMLGAAAVVLILTAAAWRALPDGRLRVTFFDVGQGDAVFIRTPSGRQVLVDGGPSPSVLLWQLGQRMPFWDHTLDLVVLSHADEERLPGLLPVLERYGVERVIAPGGPCYGALCERWQALLAGSGADVLEGQAGLRVWLDEGLLLTVLHPDAGSSDALLLRLDHGQVCFLLAGDLNAAGEAALLREGAWLDCTVLRAANHGDAASTSTPFLEAVSPETVVISVGAGNYFRQPHWEMLQRLGDLPVYRTDENGGIEVISNGQSWQVRTER